MGTLIDHRELYKFACFTILINKYAVSLVKCHDKEALRGILS